MQNTVKIGMFGYGCAGQGLHDVLLSSRGFKSDIKKICVRDRTKPRRISADHFTFEKDDILNDPEINLEEYYDSELLFAVSGIFNGSSNYILSKMYNDRLDYATALKQAQNLGFAEADPSLDVEGVDAKKQAGHHHRPCIWLIS